MPFFDLRDSNLSLPSQRMVVHGANVFVLVTAYLIELNFHAWRINSYTACVWYR